MVANNTALSEYQENQRFQLGRRKSTELGCERDWNRSLWEELTPFFSPDTSGTVGFISAAVKAAGLENSVREVAESVRAGKPCDCGWKASGASLEKPRLGKTNVLAEFRVGWVVVCLHISVWCGCWAGSLVGENRNNRDRKVGRICKG